MTCPTIDKLSQYADDLLTGQQLVEIRKHMEGCEECQQIVDVFKGEQQFIKETLKTPLLPADFTAVVLEQLEPYDKRKKREIHWKRVMLAVAGMTLAVGLSATFNPGFAAWVGGLFSTENVDEGLRIAADADLAERVNLEVVDKGLTFKVEDVVVDTSRVSLSYQIVNENGKAQKITQEIADLEDEILITDQNGKVLDDLGMTWQSIGDYGLYEFSLRNRDSLEKITVDFNIKEINGLKGNWTLEVPINLKENNDLTTIVSLDGVQTSEHGVTIKMKEVQFAPSSYELFYETGFTEKEQAHIEGNIEKLEKNHGQEIDGIFMFGSDLRYHIKNEENEVIFQNPTIFDSDNSGFLQGFGQRLDQLGHMAWNQSFVPQKEDDKLTFVLDGVIKTVPADFSVRVKPKELKKQPVSFEYEENFVKITKVEKQTDYYLRRSFLPIGKRTFLKIQMEGEKEALSPELGAWVLVDEKGKSHVVYGSGSVSDQTLTVYGLDKIPEEFTLHLLSITRYEKAENEWSVPLY